MWKDLDEIWGSKSLVSIKQILWYIKQTNEQQQQNVCFSSLAGHSFHLEHLLLCCQHTTYIIRFPYILLHLTIWLFLILVYSWIVLNSSHQSVMISSLFSPPPFLLFYYPEKIYGLFIYTIPGSPPLPSNSSHLPCPPTPFQIHDLFLVI